eukprot:494095_1
MSSLAIREVENIDREVKRILKGIDEQIQKIENGMAASSVSVPLSASQKVSQEIEHCKSRIKTMEIELQTVDNRDQRQRFKPVIRDHRAKLKEFEQSLQWSRAGAQAEERIDDRSGYDADEILNDENKAIAYGHDLLDKTDAAADRAIRDLAETQDIAVNTATTLHDQTEQIGKIDENLAEIDDEIDRASRVLKRMGRRVMTDKYIWCLIFLIFAAIIAIIVVSVMNGKVDEKDIKPNFRRRIMEQLEQIYDKMT